MTDFIKYPRTRHIQGSRLQDGDHDLEQVPFEHLLGRHVIVEEKVDGSNTGISFPDGERMLLQSRGSVIGGGPREASYGLFKQWAAAHREWLNMVLSDRYIAYGEWMFAKHTVFYDRLPHYWMEFDIYDKKEQVWLNTAARQDKVFKWMPWVAPVKVLFRGQLENLDQLKDLIGRSNFISDGHEANLRDCARKAGVDPDQVCRETDMSGLMEGVYIKIEEGGVVKDRLKFVRPDFVQAIKEADGHWMDRPIVQNQLDPSVDIFAESI